VTAAGPVGRLAEEALAIDPSSAAFQNISASLTRLRDTLASQRDPETVRKAVRDSMSPLLAMVRKAAVRGPQEDPAGDTLRSAWAADGKSR